MRETINVDLYAPDPYEVSALIISALARPEEKEKAARDRLYLSLCSFFIRERCAREPEWGKQPQLVIPNQACRAEIDIRRDFRTLQRLLKDRVTAGHFAAAFVMAVERGEVPELPPGVDDLSLNKIAAHMMEERGIADTTNFLSRIWRPSRSVIHLCTAWATLAQEHFKENGTELNLLEAARRSEFLALLIYRAELMEPLFSRSRLKIGADELIKFRMVKGGVK